MDNKKAIVFDMQRFSVHDGPGIRTTVFIKGCPLNCLWCHNPESKSKHPEIMLTESKCIGCGECVNVCPQSAHSFDESKKHVVNRENCISCGKCEAECVGAISMCGKEMTAEEVLATVIRDKSFYENSGGGMTVSGGEPLFSHDFTYELLKAAKGAKLNTAIETSGFAKWDKIECILPYVDLFLFDYKETNPEKHKEYTGVSNELILANLEKLNAAGAKVVLRCPIIPGYNDRDDHFRAIGALADRLDCITRVDVEPYHPLGRSKCDGLGIDYPLGTLSFPEKDVVSSWIEKIQSYTSKQVLKS